MAFAIFTTTGASTAAPITRSPRGASRGLSPESSIHVAIDVVGKRGASRSPRAWRCISRCRWSDPLFAHPEFSPTSFPHGDACRSRRSILPQ